MKGTCRGEGRVPGLSIKTRVINGSLLYAKHGIKHLCAFFFASSEQILELLFTLDMKKMRHREVVICQKSQSQ